MSENPSFGGHKKCVSCQNGKTTQGAGSQEEAKCGCGPGTFKQEGAAGKETMCLGCVEGMSCTDFNGDLKVKANFFVRPGTQNKLDTVIFKCEPKEACGGGLWGATKCRPPRSGFMCTDCPPDTVINSNLEEDDAKGCKECNVVSKFVLILLPVVVMCLTVYILFESRHSPLDDKPVFIEIQGIAGQLMMFMQVLNAFMAANLKYGEPMTGFTTGFTAPIGTDLFTTTPCLAVSLGDPLSQYAVQVCGPAAFIMWLMLSFQIGQCVKKNFFNRDGLCNSIGEVLIEFYISVTLAIFSPFKCYNHTTDNPRTAGVKSLAAYPSVICGESEHAQMQLLAVFGILAYPVSTVVITVLATWQHPRSMMKNDIGVLIRCHFLFNRWRADCYWFSVITVVRNFILAVLPMIMPEDQLDMSVGFMLITLVISIVMMIWFKPRRTPTMNLLDSYISFVQIVTLAVGA